MNANNVVTLLESAGIQKCKIVLSVPVKRPMKVFVCSPLENCSARILGQFIAAEFPQCEDNDVIDLPSPTDSDFDMEDVCNGNFNIFFFSTTGTKGEECAESAIAHASKIFHFLEQEMYFVVVEVGPSRSKRVVEFRNTLVSKGAHELLADPDIMLLNPDANNDATFNAWLPRLVNTTNVSQLCHIGVFLVSPTSGNAFRLRTPALDHITPVCLPGEDMLYQSLVYRPSTNNSFIKPSEMDPECVAVKQYNIISNLVGDIIEEITTMGRFGTGEYIPILIDKFRYGNHVYGVVAPSPTIEDYFDPPLSELEDLLELENVFDD